MHLLYQRRAMPAAPPQSKISLHLVHPTDTKHPLTNYAYIYILSLKRTKELHTHAQAPTMQTQILPNTVAERGTQACQDTSLFPLIHYG